MRSDLFQHEVTRTSALFGRKSDVRVVFHGQMAATDGKTIYLPQLKAGVDVDEVAQAVMRGFVDHESGHVRHSDMAWLVKKNEQWLREGRKLAKALCNALEDVRLESLVMHEYPGAARNLKATSVAVNQRTLKAWAEMPDKATKLARPSYITPVAITWQGRLEYGGEENATMLGMIPERVRERLPGYVEKALACKNSREVADLAEAIEAELIDEAKAAVRAEKKRREEAEDEDEGEDEASKPSMVEDGDHDADLYDELKEESDEASGSAAEAEEDGDDSDAEEAGAAGAEAYDPEDDAGDEGDREGDDVPPEGGDDEDDDAADAEAGAGVGEEEDEGLRRPGGGKEVPEDDGDDEEVELGAEELETYDDFDVEDTLRDRLEDEGLTGPAGPGEYQVWSTMRDRFVVGDRYGDAYERRLASGTAELYDGHLARLVGPVNVLRRGLERALAARQQRDWDFGRVQGRLDARRFPAALAGRENVFKERVERSETDTAVTFLVDLSGSMAGPPALVARDCAMALAEAIDRTAIRYEVLGFNCPLGEGRPGGVPHTHRLARWEAIYIWVFKAFEQRLFDAKPTMSRLANCVGGNNVDGESLMMAYSRLKARPEKRKVLFVLSDGSPAAACDDHGRGMDRHLRGVVRFIESQGVQTVGIGICDSAPAAYYGDHVIVSNVDQLGTTALGTLSRILLGDRRGVDRSRLIEGMRV